MLREWTRREVERRLVTGPPPVGFRQVSTITYWVIVVTHSPGKTTCPHTENNHIRRSVQADYNESYLFVVGFVVVAIVINHESKQVSDVKRYKGRLGWWIISNKWRKWLSFRKPGLVSCVKPKVKCCFLKLTENYTDFCPDVKLSPHFWSFGWLILGPIPNVNLTYLNRTTTVSQRCTCLKVRLLPDKNGFTVTCSKWPLCGRLIERSYLLF